MPAANASGIEIRAGFFSGNGAASCPSTSTWIVGESEISTSAETVPTSMLATAPAVVKRRQKIDSSSAGKFALAAIANASPTMNATFWPLKHDAEHDRDDAEHDRRDARDAQLLALVDLAVAGRRCTHRSCDERRRARQREPGDDREDRRERDRGDEAEERRCRRATSASSGAAMLPPLSTAVIALAPDEHHRAEAEHERHQVEEADEARRVEHRAPRGARVGHGVEAHQDVRQAGGAEHQREAERDRVERLRDELAGREHAGAVLLRAPPRTARAGSSRTSQSTSTREQRSRRRAAARP